MLAVICCPGPSLLTAGIPPADLVVGVNRAPLILWQRAIGVSAWVVSDADRLYPHAPPYAVDVCTSKGATIRMGRRPVKFGCPVKSLTLYEDMEPKFPRAWRWTTYSFTAAIIYAAFKGATAIECYGCDMTNAPDADGVNLPSNRRTDSRWAQERRIVTELKMQLERRGVDLRLPLAAAAA